MYQKYKDLCRILHASWNKKTVFINGLSAALCTHVIIEMIVHECKVNCHCMLFGKIFEKKRHFVEGFVPLCWIFMLTEICLIVLSFYSLYTSVKCPHYNWFQFPRATMYWKLLIGYLVVLNCFFLKGFHSLCNSLDAPVCNAKTIRNIEFKYFTPKYLDGSHFYSTYSRIQTSSWLHILCLICLKYCKNAAG